MSASCTMGLINSEATNVTKEMVLYYVVIPVFWQMNNVILAEWLHFIKSYLLW